MDKVQTPPQGPNTPSQPQPPEENSKRTILHSIMAKSVKCSKATLSKTGAFIEAILSQNKERLKALSEQGLPDDLPILRSLIWKINLGYLSIDSDKWHDTLKSQRNTYQTFKQMFIKRLKEELQLFEGFDKKTKSEKKALEQITNKGLLEDIAKDTNRTHMQFSFFFQPTNKNKQLTQEEIKIMVENRRNCTMKNINDTYKVDICETHADVLARILFIYAKFSPDVSYVQGMNEIIAPIYYSFSYDKLYEEETENNIEADTFWSFYSLMEKIKYVFIQDEDRNDRGTMGKAEKLKKMIQIVDKDISIHFDKYKLDFSFFACRWFILLFSQDFLMIDILRLWDFIFSDENKFKNVYYTALAIMKIKKDSILVSDLSGMISELQNLNGMDIEEVISTAFAIRDHFGKALEPIINRGE